MLRFLLWLGLAALVLAALCGLLTWLMWPSSPELAAAYLALALAVAMPALARWLWLRGIRLYAGASA